MAADPDLIAVWIEAWAITREVARPVRRSGAHYVDVGLPDQRARYVFPALSETQLRHLALTICDPWIYLKVCASEEEVRPLLPAHWQIRTPPTYMMTGKLAAPSFTLPAGYSLSLEPKNRVLTASIHENGTLVARGRLVVMDGIAVFDQIRTQDAYQRRGFGRAIMAELATAALDQGAPLGVLCASEMGRALYETLGWTVHAPYTSAVIPGNQGPDS